jgi:hypothetical protein
LKDYAISLLFQSWNYEYLVRWRPEVVHEISLMGKV